MPIDYIKNNETGIDIFIELGFSHSKGQFSFRFGKKISVWDDFLGLFIAVHIWTSRPTIDYTFLGDLTIEL